MHAILLAPGADMLIVESVGNLSALRNKVFYVFAFPFSAEGIGSSWLRLVAVDER